MFFYRFQSIFRTGWSKPASGRFHWRNTVPVKIYGKQKQLGKYLFNHYGKIFVDNVSNAFLTAESISVNGFSSFER